MSLLSIRFDGIVLILLISTIDFAALNSLSPSCLFGHDFYRDFGLFLLVTVFPLAVVSLGLLLVYIFYLRRLSPPHHTLLTSVSTATPASVNLATSAAHTDIPISTPLSVGPSLSPSVYTRVHVLAAQSVFLVVMFFSLMFIPVCIHVSSLFDCMQLDQSHTSTVSIMEPVWVLHSDIGVICYDSIWWHNAWLMVFPVLLFMALFMTALIVGASYISARYSAVSYRFRAPFRVLVEYA